MSIEEVNNKEEQLLKCSSCDKLFKEEDLYHLENETNAGEYFLCDECVYSYFRCARCGNIYPVSARSPKIFNSCFICAGDDPVWLYADDEHDYDYDPNTLED